MYMAQTVAPTTQWTTNRAAPARPSTVKATR